jgi:hypothetical protein
MVDYLVVWILQWIVQLEQPAVGLGVYEPL